MEDADHFGWYRGIVTKCATEVDKETTLVSMCAHVKFRNSETDGVLPVYHGDGRLQSMNATSVWPLGLTADVWGADKK